MTSEPSIPLRKQDPLSPRIAVPLEQPPLMESVRTVSPELDRIWDDAIAAPVGRSRNLSSCEATLRFRDASIEIARLRNRLALIGGPRADLTPPRARGEILIRLFVRHLLGNAFDAHLYLELLPVECER